MADALPQTLNLAPRRCRRPNARHDPQEVTKIYMLIQPELGL